MRPKRLQISAVVGSPGGISPPGAPRTVHDPLESHGSRCSAVAIERLCLVHRLLLLPVGQWPRPNNAAPSLQPHYRAFDATTGCSAPAPRFGTLALAVGAACGLSLHVVGVTRHRFSRSIRKPGRASRRLHAGCRSDSIRASPELIPEDGSPPVLTSPNPLSTLLQRFACARLAQPCLPWSCPAVSATFTTIALTTAACGGLRSAPDCRTRRALLHLSYSCALPCGRAMLVTQDPERTSGLSNRSAGYTGNAGRNNIGAAPLAARSAKLQRATGGQAWPPPKRLTPTCSP